MTRTKRILTVALIILLALAIGIGVHLLWSFLKEEEQEEKNSVNFSSIIEQYSEEYDVPKDLIFAVITVESEFDPNAKSSVGALGLMQMMPATFEWLTGDEHLNEHLPTNKLTDPEVSIRYGTYYLRYLHNKFENWDTVLAAYNGGEGNVAKWLADPECSDSNGNLTYIPFEETRNYVKKVKSSMEKYEN